MNGVGDLTAEKKEEAQRAAGLILYHVSNLRVWPKNSYAVSFAKQKR